MTYTPNTQKRNYQWRGPSSSEDYNLRVEENYKDLAVLYNQLNELEATHEESSSYLFKEVTSITEFMIEILTRIQNLEDVGSGVMTFNDSDQIDTIDFAATIFSVDADEQCTFHAKYNLITPRHITDQSVSKIKFKTDDVVTTSANLEMLVTPISPSDDSTSAIVETSQPVYAVVNEVGRIWQRNVIVPSTTANGAQMYLYIRIPTDLTVTPWTNAIYFDVFPIFGVDITDVSYSTDPKVNLNSVATWTPLNNGIHYFDIDEAIGYLPPGAWIDDTITKAGPAAFIFPNKAITAVRIGLKRTEVYDESSNKIYSYGMSFLDIRHDKFADESSVILRFDAPDGETISSVDSVNPQIWNVPEYLIDDVFSYQVIWETAFESGSYTTTPVPLSQRVWIKVTLNSGPDGDQAPALSNLIVNYS